MFPWTEMGELHLSRCTEWPWAWDIPYTPPVVEGGYWVSWLLRIESVGPAATPQQAVAMVLDHLPPNCGPAVVGTRDEPAAHDAAILPATPEDPDHSAN
ncbi:DUF6193 family natural product biosynthesis protein [Streptomyces violascens]|uniref:DUF6193 family natural product biosynthesis protein n=1 Tax=Streptomyces violascens TaxID=67381 RepID=UPI00367AF767